MGREPRRVWIDLGDFGDLINPRDPLNQYQDHGMGLLRTILHRNGLKTELVSTRGCTSWFDMELRLAGYDVALMNVRSYTFPMAYRAAKLFKTLNPQGLVVVGGMHATVAPDEMAEIPEFDKIVRGPGEGIIVDLVRDPAAFPRLVDGRPARSMAEWPMIDRRLWPPPESHLLAPAFRWPLEPSVGWGPGPVATLLTSRVCPWQCAFCSESSYIDSLPRRPVEQVIDELNFLHRHHGPLGSVVIHDSMFFQNPSWLEEWLEKYPRKADAAWPYWAAARSDTVRRWPDLFSALVRETNWRTISIGFESGSDRVLRILNKECTVEDNQFTIELVNRLGDEMERQAAQAPSFWTNVILAVPGETRDDAFQTMRMIRTIKRQWVALAFYSPYPGSILGYQIIAEGKSLMTKDNYHRYPNERKVRGVDYDFYAELLAGKHDLEVSRDTWPGSIASGSAEPPRHHVYLFGMPGGKKKLAYGRSPADAWEVLGFRLSAAELAQVDRDDCQRIPRRSLREHLHLLG